MFLYKHSVVGLIIGFFVFFFGASGFALSFEPDCPSPVAEASFTDPLVYPGPTVSSPDDNSFHEFGTGPGSWDIVSWSAAEHQALFGARTEITYPVDGSGDPLNNGRVWLYYTHSNVHELDLHAFNVNGNSITFRVTYYQNPNPTYPNDYNAYIEAKNGEPIAEVSFKGESEEAALFRTCAY